MVDQYTIGNLEDETLKTMTLDFEAKIKAKKDTLKVLLFLDGDQSWSAAKTVAEPPFIRFLTSHESEFHILVAVGPETTSGRSFKKFVERYPSFMSLLISSRRSMGSIKDSVDVCVISEAFRLDVKLEDNKNIKFCMVSDDVTVGLACHERLRQLGRNSETLSPRKHLAYWLHGALGLIEHIDNNHFVRVLKCVLQEYYNVVQPINTLDLEVTLKRMTDQIGVKYSERLLSEVKTELMTCGYRITNNQLDQDVLCKQETRQPSCEQLQLNHTEWYSQTKTVVAELLDKHIRVSLSEISKKLRSNGLQNNTIKLKSFFGQENVQTDLNAIFNKQDEYLQLRLDHNCKVCERNALKHNENGFCGKNYLDDLVNHFETKRIKEMYMNKVGMILPIPDLVKQKLSWLDLLSDPYATNLKLTIRRSELAILVYHDLDHNQIVQRATPTKVKSKIEKPIENDNTEIKGLSPKELAIKAGFDVGVKVLFRDEQGQITKHNGGTKNSPKVRVELSSGVVVYPPIHKLTIINNHISH